MSHTEKIPVKKRGFFKELYILFTFCIYIMFFIENISHMSEESVHLFEFRIHSSESVF